MDPANRFKCLKPLDVKNKIRNKLRALAPPVALSEQRAFYPSKHPIIESTWTTRLTCCGVLTQPELFLKLRIFQPEKIIVQTIMNSTNPTCLARSELFAHLGFSTEKQ